MPNYQKTFIGLIFVVLGLTAAMPVALAWQPVQLASERAQYQVVINHEEQYSIWVTDRELPKGWKATGFVGSKDNALRHIEEVWTDMRPLGLRRQKALEIYRQQQHRKK